MPGGCQVPSLGCPCCSHCRVGSHMCRRWRAVELQCCASGYGVLQSGGADVRVYLYGLCACLCSQSFLI